MSRLIVILGIAAVGAAVLVPAGWTGIPGRTVSNSGAFLYRAALAALGAILVLAGRWISRTRVEADPAPMVRTPGLLWVLGALALGLRVINLDTDLWFDEVVTLTEFVRLPVRELLTTYTTLNNHILYSLLAKGSVAAFGESAWALRVPAVVFGVAGHFALWRLVVPVAGRREASLAVLLMAVSHHHVWFSQNARGYTALLFLNLLSTALLQENLRRPARARWIAWGAVNAAALWFHLTAAFAIGAQVLAAASVLVLRGRRRADVPAGRDPGAPVSGLVFGILLCGALALLIYAPLLPQMIDAFSRQAGAESVNVKVREWTNPLWTVLEAVQSFAEGPLGLAALGVAGMIVAAGFLSYFRHHPALAAIMVLPVPIALLILKLLSFHIWPRYFFPGMAFGVLCFVRGLTVTAGAFCRGGPLRRRGIRAETLATAATILVAASALMPLVTALRLPKQDYRGAAAWVESQRAPGEPVLTAGLASLPFARLYAPEWTPIEGVEELDTALSRGSRVWLVYSFPTVLSTARPEILARAREAFVPARDFPGTIGDGTIHVFHSR